MKGMGTRQWQVPSDSHGRWCLLGANEAVDAAACGLDEVVTEVAPDRISLNIIPVRCALFVEYLAPDPTIRDL